MFAAMLRAAKASAMVDAMWCEHHEVNPRRGSGRGCDDVQWGRAILVIYISPGQGLLNLSSWLVMLVAEQNWNSRDTPQKERA
jgi:hypothetical protein